MSRPKRLDGTRPPQSEVAVGGPRGPDLAQWDTEQSDLERRILMRRILAEYREMPGLCLSSEQAARLWGLEPRLCSSLLVGLVECGKLRQMPDGRYRTAATG